MAKKANNGKVFKVSIITIGVVLLAAIVGVLFFQDNKAYTVLNKDQTAKKLSTDEDFILVLSRDWCPACNRYKDNTLRNYDGDLPVYVLEVVPEFFDPQNPRYGNNGQRYEDLDAFLEFLIDNGLSELAVHIASQNGFRSPTTVIIRNGKAVAFEEGAMDRETLDQFVSNNK